LKISNYIKYDSTSILKIVKNFIAKNITSVRLCEPPRLFTGILSNSTSEACDNIYL